ncbi:MAG TPA: hypothetical protein VEL28_10585 [Candidatus Binatia bacterium]|nr:hypothetical protein [Candidatus Binatia bacterium]
MHTPLAGAASLTIALILCSTPSVAAEGDITELADVTENNGLPRGVAVGPDGKVYIAVPDLHVVYVRDPVTGELSIFAGKLVMEGDGFVGGYFGDGGSATNAQLNEPVAVAVSPSGTVYIADRLNHRIRRVESGQIATVAGTGTPGFNGDLLASISQLSLPSGVALTPDSFGLLIADAGNERIRKIEVPTTLFISTVAGSGTRGFAGDEGPASAAQLADPIGISVDRAGNLYITDQANVRIRKVTAGNGTLEGSDIIDTIAGIGTAGFSGDGEAATGAQLSLPSRAVPDGAGNVYVADSANQRVRRIDAITGEIETIAGTGTACAGGDCGDGGPALEAELHDPVDLAFDGRGDIVLVDQVNQRVRKIETILRSGNIRTVAGNGAPGIAFSGEGGPAFGARLNLPEAVLVDGDGTFFIADSQHHRIHRVDGQTMAIETIAGNGIGGFDGDNQAAIDAMVNRPADLDFDSDGNLYLADALNNRVRRIDAMTGQITTVAGNGTFGFSGDSGAATAAMLATPSGIAFDDDDNLFIADSSNHKIRRVDAVTKIITTVAGFNSVAMLGDGGQAVDARLIQPIGVTVDNGGDLLIADTNDLRIRHVDLDTGIIRTVAGDGTLGDGGDGGQATDAQLAFPVRVAVNEAGDIFIADKDNHLVRRISALDGTISTIAGNGSTVFSGDGGPAELAGLGFLRDVVFGAGENLFVADGNSRIREIADVEASDCPMPAQVCSQPINSQDASPKAVDCLYVLKAAVGSEPCCLCPCDVNGNNEIRATDALSCLQLAVGGPGVASCTTCP